MIVCHCHGVTDRVIRAAVRDGAESAALVGRACGAGTGCGGCKPLIERLVTRERERFMAPNDAPQLPARVAG